jgi:hypothetical protein
VFFSTQPADTRTAPPRTARDPGAAARPVKPTQCPRLPMAPDPMHFAPPRAAAVAPAAGAAIMDMVIAGMMMCVRRVNVLVSAALSAAAQDAIFPFGGKLFISRATNGRPPHGPQR